jgi:hypothetical protein
MTRASTEANAKTDFQESQQATTTHCTNCTSADARQATQASYSTEARIPGDKQSSDRLKKQGLLKG